MPVLDTVLNTTKFLPIYAPPDTTSAPVVPVVAKVVSTVGKTLIWTAAAIGQGGIGHINCKNKNDWAEKLTSAGLVRNTTKEQQLIADMKKGIHMGWFTNNLLYYERT